MGYDTNFEGSVKVDPPLSQEEITYLRKFCDTRRMDRDEGPYYVDGPGPTPGVRDYNRPPPGQPGLWCEWAVDDDGTKIGWSGHEKFYYAPEWMIYVIDHFLKPGAIAKPHLPFLQANHVVSGTIRAQGEDASDRWDLIVEDNRVYVRSYEAIVGSVRRVL